MLVSQQPCCSAVGHCLIPFGTLQAQVSHLVRGVFQLPCSLKLNFFVVLAACCTLNPGCQDLGFFCRSFLRGTLSSSDQASVTWDALVKPRLDFLLMSRRRALDSGLFGCSSFCFRCESKFLEIRFESNKRTALLPITLLAWVGSGKSDTDRHCRISVRHRSSSK